MGASQREGKSTQPVARRAGEGAWELGSGTRIQHPGDLEARPYSGGHLVQGEEFGSGDVGCWPEAEVLHRPAGSAQASRLPTLLLLGDPRSHSFFSCSAGFRVPGLSVCWARACAQEAAPGHNAMQSGHGALATGLTQLVLGAALRRRCGACGRHGADQMGPQRGSRLGQEGQQI